MTAVDLPEEPPVGTELTAPRMDNHYVRTEKGWYVTDFTGRISLPNLVGASWSSVVRNLRIFGGIETVTTEYQVEARITGSGATQTKFREIFYSRESALNGWPDTVEVIALRSQRVTRSAWRDEPLEETRSR